MNVVLVSLFFSFAVIIFFTLYWHKIESVIFSREHQEPYIRICPHCGSTDTKVDFTNPVVWAYGTSVEYECNRCGERGKIFPEVAKEDKKAYSSKIKSANKKQLVHNDKLFDITHSLPAAIVFFGIVIWLFFGLISAFLFYALAIIVKLFFSRSR